jgi:predicted restriction endonuclease
MLCLSDVHPDASKDFKTLVSQGLELSLEKQLDFIIDTPLWSVMLREFTENISNTETPVINQFVNLISPHLSQISDARRKSILAALSYSPVGKLEFQLIFNNLPAHKSVKADILVNSCTLHGVEFASSLLDIAISREVFLIHLYPATEVLSELDRIQLLSKASFGGRHITSPYHRERLTPQEIESGGIYLNPVPILSEEIKKKLETGESAKSLLRGIVEDTFYPRMQKDFLTKLVFENLSEPFQAYREMIQIAKEAGIILTGNAELLDKILSEENNEQLSVEVFESIKSSLHRPWEEKLEFFTILACISERSLLKIFNHAPAPDGVLDSNTVSNGRFWSELIGQLHIIEKFVPDIHGKMCTDIWSKYLKSEHGNINAMTLRTYIKNLSLSGSIAELRSIENTFGVNSELFSTEYFQKKLCLAYINLGKLDIAFDIYKKIDLQDQDNSYIVFKLCDLARTNNRPDICLEIAERYLKENIQIEIRNLTIIVRAQRINDPGFLLSFFNQLSSSKQPIDSFLVLSFCQKLRLAGAPDELEKLIETATRDYEFENIRKAQFLAELLWTYLDNDQLKESLTTVKRIADVNPDASFTTLLENQIMGYDQPLVYDAFRSWRGLPVPLRKREYRQSRTRIINIDSPVRDADLPATLKRMYGSLCQLCRIPLITPSGLMAEGAHIRPLGAGHDGLDLIENLLCLCPNHHKLLDGHGWYLTDKLEAVETTTGRKCGTLYKLPDHDISLSCVRYQRRVALNNLKSYI